MQCFQMQVQILADPKLEKKMDYQDVEEAGQQSLPTLKAVYENRGTTKSLARNCLNNADPKILVLRISLPMQTR